MSQEGVSWKEGAGKAGGEARQGVLKGTSGWTDEWTSGGIVIDDGLQSSEDN